MQQNRPEMKGPQQSVDINNILSGLKTRTITPEISMEIQEENDSMISVNSIRDMNNMSMPKRSNNKRRQKSDKNTISLDI